MSRRQEEEKAMMKKTQRKSSKLIAYLSIESEIVILYKRKCNALSNSQTGVSKISIIHKLKLNRIISN